MVGPRVGMCRPAEQGCGNMRERCVKTKSVLVASLAVGFLFAAVVCAEDIVHKPSGLKFELPKGWKIKTDGDDIELLDPEDGFGIELAVAGKDDLDAILKEIDKQIEKEIKDFKVKGEPQKSEAGGLTHIFLAGSGKHDGKETHVMVDIVTGGKKTVVLTAWGHIEKEATAKEIQT